MKCVVLQPSYIPWRGYFHQVQKADVFVFYDSIQYDRHGWRNRNRVKGPCGSQWLTIPVLSKGTLINLTPINRIRIKWDSNWAKAHWATIQQFYRKAPYFHKYKPLLEDFYSRRLERLADFTIDLTLALAQELNIKATKFIRSSDLLADGLTKTDRLLSILKYTGTTHYITGPSAKDYLEEEKLYSAGITTEYMDYSYPEYPQLYPPFDPHVSILDLLFMTGPEAPQYMRNVPAASEPVHPRLVSQAPAHRGTVPFVSAR